MKTLVIGGAGFIGSHLVDNLLEKKHDVIVYDNLEPQVHETQEKAPDYLATEITFLKKDIRDENALIESQKHYFVPPTIRTESPLFTLYCPETIRVSPATSPCLTSMESLPKSPVSIDFKWAF